MTLNGNSPDMAPFDELTAQAERFILTPLDGSDTEPAQSLSELYIVGATGLAISDEKAPRLSIFRPYWLRAEGDEVAAGEALLAGIDQVKHADVPSDGVLGIGDSALRGALRWSKDKSQTVIAGVVVDRTEDRGLRSSFFADLDLVHVIDRGVRSNLEAFQDTRKQPTRELAAVVGFFRIDDKQTFSVMALRSVMVSAAHILPSADELRPRLRVVEPAAPQPEPAADEVKVAA